MAIPVADSTRGYGFWPNTMTFQSTGGLGFKAWKVSSRSGIISGLRFGPTKAG
eukprot:CAMPEP_0194704272 /NCGR_PEP_ID=MMETSP0295-20121207/28174_1 /TAXON_ID=39354 /ORGANISM="Heterosigma akashiwo, Strain CCMP2393" /LENGTH=52 /DNA_ID=CAMNT_0039599605 /DNA_START=427 /DNA_END=582 /DNA_ORIENTATION=+